MEVALRLRNLSEDEARFIGQVGVEYVDVGIDVLPGYQAGVLPGFQRGRLDLRYASKVVERVRAANLEVSCFYGTPIREALMGGAEGEKQLEDLSTFIRLLGAESVPVIQVGLEEVRHGPTGVPGRYEKEHRDTGCRPSA